LSSLDSNGHKNFGLTQSGHINFAHRMSLHLCHYLVDCDVSVSECPFDRHEEYIGHLYVPEAADLGKLIEEKKIEKVKEVFGVE